MFGLFRKKDESPLFEDFLESSEIVRIMDGCLLVKYNQSKTFTEDASLIAYDVAEDGAWVCDLDVIGEGTLSHKFPAKDEEQIIIDNINKYAASNGISVRYERSFVRDQNL